MNFCERHGAEWGRSRLGVEPFIESERAKIVETFDPIAYAASKLPGWECVRFGGGEIAHITKRTSGIHVLSTSTRENVDEWVRAALQHYESCSEPSEPPPFLSFRNCIVSVPIIGTIPAVPPMEWSPMEWSQAVHGIARTASKPVELTFTPCAECDAPLRPEQVKRHDGEPLCAYCLTRVDLEGQWSVGLVPDKLMARRESDLNARIEAATAPQPEPERDAADWDVVVTPGWEWP
ncbi:MAG: hypothetical protein EPO32_14680 [Anaerolineae bacterium]|nr:MAG: hypothetical protein EPO32_14680 [Anaerolineae bacterium]